MKNWIEQANEDLQTIRDYVDATAGNPDVENPGTSKVHNAIDRLYDILPPDDRPEASPGKTQMR